MDEEKQDAWEFNFNDWTLDDVVKFEQARGMAARLPMIATAVKKTPGIPDLGDRENWKKVSIHQWAELQRRFTQALEEIFR